MMNLSLFSAINKPATEAFKLIKTLPLLGTLALLSPAILAEPVKDRVDITNSNVTAKKTSHQKTVNRWRLQHLSAKHYPTLIDTLVRAGNIKPVKAK